MADLSHFPVQPEQPGLSCADVESDQAAYIWGALPPAERDRVELHRRGCPACDERLHEAALVVAELDRAAPKIAPPAELRGRVLEAIARVEPAPRAAPSRTLAPVAEQPPHGAGASFGRVLPLAARGAARRGSFFAGVATGLVGAAAAAALVVVMLLQPTALGLLGAAEAQFGGADQDRRWPGVTLPWQAPAARANRLIELGSASAPGRGLLAYDAQTKRGVLLLQGLSLSSGADYAVWIGRGTQRVQLGTVSVDGRGVASFVLPDPLPLDDPEWIEVGPAGGSPGAGGGTLSARF